MAFLGREIRDQRTIADALVSQGRLSLWQGLYHQARQLCEESLVVARTAEIVPFIIGALNNLGDIARALRRLDEARAHFEESLSIARDDGKGPGIVGSLIHLADLMVDQGEYATAQKYFQQSFEIPPGKADRGRYATVRAGLERIALLSGEYFEAYEHYEASTDAVLLASLVAHHPASYAESKDIALGVLNSPEASLFVASPVAAGRSNREIAQDLTLAVGTIKSQLHNILQKLDAKSRTQAVARARVLHLL